MEIPFTIIDWETIPAETKNGISGEVIQHVQQYAGLKIRIVEYSPGYFADHWCQKGHIVHCLNGSFVSEMESGEKYYLKEGMTYCVTDDMSSHRSHTDEGTKLLIIDGDFLKK